MYVNQSVHHPVGVNAFGSYVVRVEPDHATVAFSVSHTAATPGEAVAAVERARLDVARVLAARGLTTGDVTTSQLGLQLATEGHGKDHRVLGYQAHLRYDVRVTPCATVPELVIELVDAGARAIHGVQYHSARLRELRATAREQAFAAARAKAELYAGCAGLRVGRALHVEDVDPESLGRRGHNDLDLTAHAELDAGATGSLSIAAGVMVCFALVD